jgi:hypothetical protein
MNIIMYKVLNADTPVIFAGVSIHIPVKSVTWDSVERAVLQNINMYIVVSAHMPVQCVKWHSVRRAV